MSQAQRTLSSKIGPLHLVASDQGLQGVFWRAPGSSVSRTATAAQARHLDAAEEQLRQYLDGERQAFDLSFDVAGTEFQKRTWAQLAKIPFGQTRSYKDIAVALGDAKAFRAVGTANGRNPLSLIVPCHRVIAADGTLGGYAGGLAIKERLLVLEKTGRLP